MIKRLFFLFVLGSLALNAQVFQDDLDAIIEAETKSALNTIDPNATRNFNTGNYDLKYHRLEFNIDPSVAFISGDVTSYFVAKENLNQITFELSDNMSVSQVAQRGTALSFVQNANDEVVITLTEQQNLGVLDSLTISYSGNPISSGFGSFEQTTRDGDPIIWTLSEPYGAKGWWPCKQDLNDKIDAIDVFITTPVFNASNEELIAVSNGLEQGQFVDGDFKTTHFKHQYAIPAYLIAIAVTNYEVFTQTVPNNGNPFEIVNYVFPESLADAQANTPVTVDIMNLFTNLFEEYPFANEKYGHAQFGWGGGMEHTTVSFMGNFGRNLIAHELAHQWFGNKITCGSWKDIWLNESFATYLSGLVYENLDGDAVFTNWKQSRVNSITSQPGGSVYLTDQDTTSVGRIFSGRLSYNKGSMVLHMLRKKLDDTNFFQGLKNYLADSNLAYDYAKTDDFIAIMETTSGEDLTAFFNDWLFNEGYPSYTMFWEQSSENALQIQLDQIQSHPSVSFFEAPVPVRVIGTLGETLDLVLEHTSSGQVFNQSVSFEIASIAFDPDVDLISKDNEVLPLLSIEAFDLDAALKLFPIPSDNFFSIKKPDNLTITSIAIYNMLGQLIFETPFSNVINIEGLSSGMHFVKFSTNKGTLHKSLLKK